MHPFHMMLVLFSIGAMIGFGFVLRWERKRFFARGLVDSWFIVRLSSVPAAVVVVAIVMIPARSISGMEGLAVFYLLILTAAPLFWFGTHWVVGRLARPQLSFGDSAGIAGSPLLYLVAVAMVAPMLQSLAWSALRSLGID